MEQSETPDFEKIKRERLSHYFTTADKFITGNAHRDEHILRLYESAEKSEAFANIEDAIYVFSLATGFLWEYRLEPFEAIYGINNLFAEYNLAPIQQRILLTHLADYAEGAQRTVHTDEQTTTISLNKIARFLLVERDKIPDPASNETPFLLSEKPGAKTNIIRVLAALYELNLIELKDGKRPTKAQFMQQVGGFMGVDMNRYEQTLSTALDQPLEVNLGVFNELIKVIQSQVFTRQEKGRK